MLVILVQLDLQTQNSASIQAHFLPRESQSKAAKKRLLESLSTFLRALESRESEIFKKAIIIGSS